MYVVEFLFNMMSDLVVIGIFLLLGILVRNHMDVVNYFRGYGSSQMPPPQNQFGAPVAQNKVAGWLNILSICFFILGGMRALEILGDTWSLFSYY